MAFGREVHDRIDRSIGPQPGDEVVIADIAMDEFDPVQPIQIGGIAGIGQPIENVDRVTRLTVAPETNEIGTDEAGPAGHEKHLHVQGSSHFKSYSILRSEERSVGIKSASP